MNKKLLVIGISFFFITFFLIGCISDKTNQEKILGSWIKKESIGENETVEFNFFSNETFSLIVKVFLNEDDEDLTVLNFWEPYTIDDKKIEMIIEGNSEVLEYSFSNDDNTLTLIEDIGETTILIRQ